MWPSESVDQIKHISRGYCWCQCGGGGDDGGCGVWVVDEFFLRGGRGVVQLRGAATRCWFQLERLDP
jgi:hypothetical protein